MLAMIANDNAGSLTPAVSCRASRACSLLQELDFFHRHWTCRSGRFTLGALSSHSKKVWSPYVVYP